ncbi:D5-type cyclin, putative [Theobroma cacao]|uniref:D5-type cyclin, putative n=1 Tax=Theobroma cacao TaxID=3641 RepID=A0A061DH00_THECC|nr:D5-type cyclin, putative [Theobroma cacao]
MGGLDTSLSCSSLLCPETVSSFSETERDDDQSVFEDDESVLFYKSSFVTEGEDEFIEKLVQREIAVGFKTNASFSDYESACESWQGGARLDAIEWIFNTRATFRFEVHTAYLSVTYYDQFLAKKPINDGYIWSTRLLSVACFLLAAKFEERRVPPSSELRVRNFLFQKALIKKMEVLVLGTLQWKMGTITPFAYLPYFISKFYGESGPKGLVSRALEHIMAMIKEMRLLDHRPSFIAAAAVLAASDVRLTKEEMELKMNFISFWGSRENEHIFSCYNMMQEIEMRKSRTPEHVISSEYSANQDPEDPSATSNGAGAKRKLTFNDPDGEGHPSSKQLYRAPLCGYAVVFA